MDEEIKGNAEDDFDSDEDTNKNRLREVVEKWNP